MAQLAQDQRAGAQQGVSEHELWFTLSVGARQPTAHYAVTGATIETSDPNAIVVLRANGLIERFMSIAPTGRLEWYRVIARGFPLSDVGVS